MANQVPAMQRGRSKGAATMAVLPGSALLTIVSLIQAPVDRNRVSQVCRAMRACDRQTRSTLCLRCLRSEIWFLPLCFQAVTELDLTAVTLLAPRFFLHTAELHRLRAAFPRLTSLRLPAVTDVQTTAIAALWPGLRKLSYAANALPPAQAPRLRHALKLFRSCQAISAENFACDGGLMQGFPSQGCPELRSLNVCSVVVTQDEELEMVADRCPGLESLCLTARPGPCLSGEAFLALTRACPGLSSLSVCLSPGPGDPASIIHAMAAACGERPGLALDLSLERVPRLETYAMAGMAGALGSLVLLCTDADMAALPRSCPSLVEVTFGSCPGLHDQDLVALAMACRGLRTLRLLHCINVTERGLAGMAAASSSSITSLSLCYLRPRMSTLLGSIRAMAGTLRALRLMGDRGVDSLAGLSNWPALARLEVTIAAVLPPSLLQEPSLLSGCPLLHHLALMFQTWCPPSLHFLRKCPSLTSLALCFSHSSSSGQRQTAVEHACEIAALPRLVALSVHISSKEWLSREAGRCLARCPVLSSLDVYWAEGSTAKAGVRPFLVELLSLRTLRHAHLPYCPKDEDDLKAFYKGIHSNTMRSLLKCVYDLKMQTPTTTRHGRSMKIEAPAPDTHPSALVRSRTMDRRSVATMGTSGSVSARR